MGYMLILLLTTPVEIGPFTSIEDCHAAAAAVTQAVETNGATSWVPFLRGGAQNGAICVQLPATGGDSGKL
jgi:hypothetical protein